jgi:hypothetical protein
MYLFEYHDFNLEKKDKKNVLSKQRKYHSFFKVMNTDNRFYNQ